jgi:aspartate/methionine/tyrosine aminotransferase
MNFSDFQKLRDRTLHEPKGTLDCAATNLYAALAHLIPPDSSAPKATIHRCHLAGEWAQRFGFAREAESRALVSRGVRDSLALLFGHYAGRNARLWLPSDNYPVYGDLARAAQIAPQEFPTLPEPSWPDAAPWRESELLLVTNPLKPLGRWLTAHDIASLTAWLARSPQRRVILDAVYTFDTCFHPSTLALLATGQTILLHSLTKGWLHPRLFGTALVPEADVPALTPVFRAQPPPQANLARARELMGRHPEMPSAVSAELAAARERLVSMLPAQFPKSARALAPGYFHVIETGWSALLEKENVLGLPATVFGSPRENITILSALSFINRRT